MFSLTKSLGASKAELLKLKKKKIKQGYVILENLLKKHKKKGTLPSKTELIKIAIKFSKI